MSKSKSLSRGENEWRIIATLSAAFKALETQVGTNLHPKVHPYSSRAVKKGSYSFIPYPSHQLVKILFELEEKLGADFPKTFIDFGSGPGSKLILASSTCLFHNIAGFEYLPRYIKFASHNKFEVPRTLQRDILNITKDDLKEAARVHKDRGVPRILAYYYCPFSDYQKECRFEEHLEDILPSGSVVIAALKKSNLWSVGGRFRPLFSKQGVYEDERLPIVFQKV